MAGTIDRRIHVRMKKELRDLEISPPEGVICYPVNDNILHLKAELTGPKDTPYTGGIFKLDIHIPDRYPFDPPRCQFITKIYHPNIDDQGRICLNILKTKPKGIWCPAISIVAMLTSIIVLLGDPNPDDPLLIEIASEFKENRALFNQKAQEYTRMYAIKDAEDHIQPVQQHEESASSKTRKQQDVDISPVNSPSDSLDKTNLPTTISNVIPLTAASNQAFQQSSAAKGSMSRSLSRTLLRKPSLKSHKANTDAALTATTISDSLIDKSPSLNVSQETNISGNDTAHRHVEGENCNKTNNHMGTGWQASPASAYVDTATAQNTMHPTLADTIPADSTPILDKRREHETTRCEFAATSESPKSKKLKTTKSSSSRRESNRMEKVLSEPIPSLDNHSLDTLRQLPSSQPARVFSDAQPLCLLPKLQRHRSDDKLTKEAPKQSSHLKGAHGPLQPVEQNRCFSSDNEIVIDRANIERLYTPDDSWNKSTGRAKVAESIGLGKGKGKAKDKELKETDENDYGASTSHSNVPKIFEKRSIISEPNANNNIVVSMTVAQKRNLLKKNRP
ncbi:Ubiquitin-conjugating enzyme E2 T [Entomortierella chlamydospora]|uniref:E2 ubiquitin-conjugating enzyme n=1 Tax=Entomortierella chlamydospora TaxID=101097 RepID=A0A9P6MNR9_9FUNG|nr:Ubiquitin-conjugating enzyme E2 T [Entomortierella chlamydospora]KAG0008688.1 Ubiquitin-conjugating enzyme E2 T [Entomortierella chlamydospora]